MNLKNTKTFCSIGLTAAFVLSALAMFFSLGASSKQEPKNYASYVEPVSGQAEYQPKVLVGSGTPSNSDGHNGDSYINTDTMDIYVKENGQWNYEANLNGQDARDGLSIKSIVKVSTDQNIDTYVITYSDESTVSFIVTNGVDGIPGVEGQPGEDGITPYVEIGQNGNFYINGRDTGIKATGPKGENGNDGRSVIFISRTSFSEEECEYTIYYTDGTTSTFKIVNGTNGEQGIQGIQGDDGYTPEVTIGENGNWFVDGEDTDLPATGPKGVRGEPGVSVTSIELTGSDDFADYYTIYYSDGTEGTFRIPHGVNGATGPEGIQGPDGHTPIMSIGTNGNWYVDGNDTGVYATGAKGEKGPEGWKGSKGSKGDYVNKVKITDGHLIITYYSGLVVDAGEVVPTAELCTVTWKYGNGYTSTATTTVIKGMNAVSPSLSVPTGQTYVWKYIDAGVGKEWRLNAFAVESDMTLYGDLNTKKFFVTFDPNGGTISTNTAQFTYGDPYSLEIPSSPNGELFVAWVTSDGYPKSNTGTATDMRTYYKAVWGKYIPIDPGIATNSLDKVLVGPGIRRSSVSLGVCTAPMGYRFDYWYMEIDGQTIPDILNEQPKYDYKWPEKWMGDKIDCHVIEEHWQDSGSSTYHNQGFTEMEWQASSASTVAATTPRYYMGYPVKYIRVRDNYYYRAKTLYMENGYQSIRYSSDIPSIEEFIYLKDNDVDDSEIKIDFRMFTDNRNIKKVVFPNNLTYIGQEAFKGTLYLDDITLGTGLSYIGPQAFHNAGYWTSDGIPEITYRGTKAEWLAIEKAPNWRLSPTSPYPHDGDYILHATDGTFNMGAWD